MPSAEAPFAGRSKVAADNKVELVVEVVDKANAHLDLKRESLGRVYRNSSSVDTAVRPITSVSKTRAGMACSNDRPVSAPASTAGTSKASKARDLPLNSPCHV